MKKSLNIIIILTLISSHSFSQSVQKPVTPGASPEAVALLNLIYATSGKTIITGQHNYPNIKDRNTRFAHEYIGKTPVIFSTDWGFEHDGNTDSYLARPDIVQEAIRQHKLGSIITICWHAVPPTAKEPVTFRPLPGAKPDSLASVQGQLTDQQFMDILTPGTQLYKQWCSQVDSVAKYLKMLQLARIPILWRPYHEMNGSWFWWGGRQGKYSTIALYKQLYDRIVNYHKINNLVWVWSVDRPNKEEMQFKNFYPGTKYLDILALDVYGNDFNQKYYDNLLALSDGKPITLGEVGNPPAPEIIKSQPLWAYYVIWAGMVRNTSKKQYDILTQNNLVCYQEDQTYINYVLPFRAACGLSPLEKIEKLPVNFSGTWIFDEENSTLGSSGASNLPYKISVLHQANSFDIQKTFLTEFADNRIDTLNLTINGKELVTQFRNTPMYTTATHVLTSDTLEVKSKATFTRGDRTINMINNEKWYLTGNNDILYIQQYSSSFWGERSVLLKFNREPGYYNIPDEAINY